MYYMITSERRFGSLDVQVNKSIRRLERKTKMSYTLVLQRFQLDEFSDSVVICGDETCVARCTIGTRKSGAISVGREVRDGGKRKKKNHHEFLSRDRRNGVLLVDFSQKGSNNRR